MVFRSTGSIAAAIARRSAVRRNRPATLVLLRHGQSVWNANPTFTGWCDAPLTARGVSEAKASGLLLRDRGLAPFDRAFTSTLQRAVRTCELALGGASGGSAAVTSIERAWELNERHYGLLQGRRKDDPLLAEKYGAEKIRSWRRDFDSAPPALFAGHEHYMPPPAPLTESLRQCQERVLSYWHSSILPALAPGQIVFVAAHSNTLRALIVHLDGVPVELVPFVRVPNGVPCVYHLDDTGRPVSPLLETEAGGSRGQWILSAENHARLRDKIGKSGSLVRSIFEAWDANGDGVLTYEEIARGLRELRGGDCVATGALATKILEGIAMDGKRTLDIDEFETSALETCRKFAPDLMENI